MNKLIITKAIATILCCGAMLTACNSEASDSASEKVIDKDTTEESSTKEQSSHEAPANNSPELIKILQKNLIASGITTQIISAVPTEMDNIYWVAAEGIPPFFADKGGKFIMQGSIIAIGGEKPVDITAKLHAQTAKKKLAEVPKEEMVVYPAKGDMKSVMYVFTDSTCPYCQKLHEDVDKINAKGIEVRYLAWPRNQSGVVTLNSIWCSEDKKQAMDLAKSGGNLTAKNCESPVDKQSELGLSVGVQGTPAIFTAEGEQIGGYLPLDELVKKLGL